MFSYGSFDVDFGAVLFGGGVCVLSDFLVFFVRQFLLVLCLKVGNLLCRNLLLTFCFCLYSNCVNVRMERLLSKG